MRSEWYTIEILKELGVYKRYKGCEYIVSCIDYISNNEKTFLPMTKVLYADIAEEYHTSARCIERDMRNVITTIWERRSNEALMKMIFGECNLRKRPTNMEFLMLLHNHIKYAMMGNCLIDEKESLSVICPLTGKVCGQYGEKRDICQMW